MSEFSHKSWNLRYFRVGGGPPQFGLPPIGLPPIGLTPNWTAPPRLYLGQIGIVLVQMGFSKFFIKDDIVVENVEDHLVQLGVSLNRG